MMKEIRPGDLLPIPCRACGSVLLPFTVDWGRHVLTCPRCASRTQVDVREERGLSRIRTQEVRGNSSSGSRVRPNSGNSSPDVS